MLEFTWLLNFIYFSDTRITMTEFTNREKFITTMMFLKYSAIYKKLPNAVQQQFLSYLRDKECPVSDDEWREIAKNVGKTLKDTKRGIMKAFTMSVIYPNKVKEDNALLKMDRAMRDNLTTLNFEEMAKEVDLNPDEQRALDIAKKMKEDFDSGR